MQLDFAQTLILVLLGLLFFKETVLSWIAQKLGFKSPDSNTRRLLDVQGKMTELKTHFNDETTYILTDIQTNMGKHAENFDKFRECQVSQGSKLEEIRDALRDIGRNGVRIRKG